MRRKLPATVNPCILTPPRQSFTRQRTCGWFGKYRRLSKDYEYLTASSEAMIYVAMIHLMVRRIEAKTLF